MQATVEVANEAPLLAAPVDLGHVWLLYALLSVVFLVVLYRWIRRWPKWAIIPVWSAFAAGALTPAQINGELQLSAPAAIVAILGAEQNGLEGFMAGALPILVTYIAIMLILSGLFWWIAQRSSTNAQEITPVAEQISDPKEQARAEPKL